jgi:hypothetical protein
MTFYQGSKLAAGLFISGPLMGDLESEVACCYCLIEQPSRPFLIGARNER